MNSCHGFSGPSTRLNLSSPPVTALQPNFREKYGQISAVGFQECEEREDCTLIQNTWSTCINTAADHTS